MKAIFKRTSLLLMGALIGISTVQAQKVPPRHGPLHRCADEEK